MPGRSLFELLRSRFPEDPEAVFLEHERGVLRYAEAEALSARHAAVLAGAGVEAGDRVLVQVAKSPEAVALYLACLRLGAVFVPLNPAYTAAELEYFIADSEPRAVICAPSRAGETGALLAPGTVLLTLGPEGEGTLSDRAREAAPHVGSTPRGGGDLAAILYTSGTTGRSKGAMLSHDNLASNALTLHEIWRFRPGDVLLHALPIFHVHGLFVALHCAMLNGSRVIFQSRFDVDALVARLPDATVLMGVPTFYTRLLEHPGFGRESCANMRLFISGSAPLLPETFARFEQRTGRRILERYGMTETGMITSNPCDGERIAGTVGFPLPGVRVRVADGEGRELPRGAVGMLEVAGPNVFAGYWKMPERSAAEFRPDGWFITGDLAVMDEAGRVSIVGRAKDVVISGGYNIYPKEVEEALDRLEGVRESAVIGLPEPDLGEAVVAVVVPEGQSAPDPEALREALRGRLAGFKVPKRVVLRDALPRNAMGKVQKNLLREELGALLAGGAGAKG